MTLLEALILRVRGKAARRPAFVTGDATGAVFVNISTDAETLAPGGKPDGT